MLKHAFYWKPYKGKDKTDDNEKGKLLTSHRNLLACSITFLEDESEDKNISSWIQICNCVYFLILLIEKWRSRLQKKFDFSQKVCIILAKNKKKF